MFRRLIRSTGWRLLLLGLGGLFGLAALLAALSWVSGASTSDAAVNPVSGTVTMAISTEPPTLDSTQGADTISGFVLGHVMEGLLRYDAHNRLVPGVAYKWKITSTGATFWLRHDALWSDGKPVTAHDFVFAWRHVADPKNASQQAQAMERIKNGKAVIAGKLPLSALGVQAVGDYELRVEFAGPVPFFDQLAAFSPFFPVRQDFYQSTHGTYAADADKLLYNGPYTLAEWVHGSHIRMVKNPRYWNHQAVHVKVIDIPYFTTDIGALTNLFRDGKIAFAPISGTNLKDAQLLRWNIHSEPNGGIFYLGFNFRKDRPVTANLDFRKAVQYALSPSTLVNKVIKIPGDLPAHSIFPSWLEGVHGKFAREYPPERITPDPVKARHYLALAKRQLGLKTFPPLSLLVDEGDFTNRIAQYYQSTLKRVLGLDIRIDQQTFKQRIAKTQAGDFDINMGGWAPAALDPSSFGALFDSANPNNSWHFSDPAYDALVEVTRNSGDQAVRMRAFAGMQKIIADQVVVLPQYESNALYVVNPGIKGVVVRIADPSPDLTYATFAG